MKNYFVNKSNVIKFFDKNEQLIGSIFIKDGMYFEYEILENSIYFSMDDGKSILDLFSYKILIYRTVLEDIPCYKIEMGENV